ncbi:MAG: hypothetical protein AAF658_16260, partial [Myxococcota bacterium]
MKRTYAWALALVVFAAGCDSGSEPEPAIGGDQEVIDNGEGSNANENSSPAECEASTPCTNDDGCCATNCTSLNDNDCEPVCGNGAVEDGELCDGDCPESCDDNDACTMDGSVGSIATCDLTCTNVSFGCGIDDGCCAVGCDAL